MNDDPWVRMQDFFYRCLRNSVVLATDTDHPVNSGHLKVANVTDEEELADRLQHLAAALTFFLGLEAAKVSPEKRATWLDGLVFEADYLLRRNQ
jgi:hypothetical protein